MKAKLEIRCKDPENIIKSINPDIDETGKFDVELKADKDEIKIKIKSNDISGLLAGVNSYLRLIKTTIDLEEIK